MSSSFHHSVSQTTRCTKRGGFLFLPSLSFRFSHFAVRRGPGAGVVLSMAVLTGCTPESPAEVPKPALSSSTKRAPDTTDQPEPSNAAGVPERAKLVEHPPDFELERLRGGTVRLSEHLGKDVILIDFWATFCDPCLAAMPHLEQLYQKYRARGFVVLGVSIDGPDSVARVRSEVSKLGVTFPILLDQETQVVGLYNPKTSAPFSVLIARDGRRLVQKEGYTSGDVERLSTDIDAALK